VIGIDTNVLVRFLLRDDPSQVARADQLFRSLSPDRPGFVPLIVWAECYWVLTGVYRLAPAQVIDSLLELLNSDEITSQAEPQVRAALNAAGKGADFADALVQEAARASGCSEWVTFDKAAAKKLGFRLL
jgi:predicted nucleic-acid-binding protein